MTFQAQWSPSYALSHINSSLQSTTHKGSSVDDAVFSDHHVGMVTACLTLSGHCVLTAERCCSKSEGQAAHAPSTELENRLKLDSVSTTVHIIIQHYSSSSNHLTTFNNPSAVSNDSRPREVPPHPQSIKWLSTCCCCCCCHDEPVRRCLYGGTKMSRRDEEFHQTLNPEGSVSPSW